MVKRLLPAALHLCCIAVIIICFGFVGTTGRESGTSGTGSTGGTGDSQGTPGGDSVADGTSPTVADDASGTTTASNKFTGELEQNVTLRILENDTAIQQGYLKELLDAFNAEYADQGIVAVDANMDQYLDLEQDGPYGYGPDVLYQANDVLMKYVKGQHILALPVESLECYAQTPDSAWEVYKSGGATYGVPVNVQSAVMYYRKDLLPSDWETNWDENANQVPDMLESWNAIYRYSQGLKEESQGTRYGYMKSLFDVYFSSGYLFSYGGYLFGNDVSDIGLSAGNARLGANVVRQLASVMNEDCIDDTITKNQYAKLASGEYVMTMTTPDVYSLFTKELALAGVDESNLGIATLPMLPADGDITGEGDLTEEGEMIPTKMMGGVNGYAISSYSKAPNACLAFVNFATSYDMIKRRNELLGIAPARSDAAETCGGSAAVISEALKDGNIVMMPSVSELAQVWTPAQTFFTDVAKDPFRVPGEEKYPNLETLQEGLEKVDQQIYDAIFTLQ
jgi:arabinogalactan oligomer/maltooligosaccharide transport system substrate-binding protein